MEQFFVKDYTGGAFVFVVNLLIGSNYLFIAHKPPNLLPEWPWYIAWMEVVGIFTCLILYLPFAIKNWRAKVKSI